MHNGMTVKDQISKSQPSALADILLGPCSRLWQCIYKRDKALALQLRRRLQLPISEFGVTKQIVPAATMESSSKRDRVSERESPGALGDNTECSISPREETRTPETEQSLSPSSTQLSAECDTPACASGDDIWHALDNTSVETSGDFTDGLFRLREEIKNTQLNNPPAQMANTESWDFNGVWAFTMFEDIATSSWS